MRRRSSYRRFAEFYDFLATGPGKGDILRQAHRLLDACGAFGSSFNARKAWESMERVLLDRGADSKPMLEYASGRQMPYILTISERGNSWAGRSPVRSEHGSHAEAEAELLDYVRRNWAAEMDTDQPSDPDRMVREYFSEVLEAYEISDGGQ